MEPIKVEFNETDKNAIFDALEALSQTEHKGIYEALRKTYQKLYDEWVSQL